MQPLLNPPSEVEQMLGVQASTFVIRSYVNLVFSHLIAISAHTHELRLMRSKQGCLQRVWWRHIIHE